MLALFTIATGEEEDGERGERDMTCNKGGRLQLQLSFQHTNSHAAVEILEYMHLFHTFILHFFKFALDLCHFMLEVYKFKPKIIIIIIFFTIHDWLVDSQLL